MRNCILRDILREKPDMILVEKVATGKECVFGERSWNSWLLSDIFVTVARYCCWVQKRGGTFLCKRKKSRRKKIT